MIGCGCVVDDVYYTATPTRITIATNTPDNFLLSMNLCRSIMAIVTIES